MLRCAHCGKSWPAEFALCPDDGSTLEGSIVAVFDAPLLRPDLQAGEHVGEFRIERKLGEGGMGSVYAATHPLIGKRAAIKVIAPELCTDPASVKRFIQEARVVNEIRHPNIVDIFSFGRLSDGRVYFVMEGLEGETLMQRMVKGRLPLGQSLALLDQICDALEAAHEHGVIHRDLKPDNVFLVPVKGRPDQVQLLDFGIAKLVGQKDPSISKDSENNIFGTPHYVSPEQARGRDVDGRADVYSLGVMAFEMILGRLPFLADNAADLVQMHLHKAPPRPRDLQPDLPAELDALLLAMLDKSPDGRPALAEVRRRLARLGAELSQARLLAVPPEPRTERTRRARTSVVIAAGVVVVVGAIGAVVVANGRSPLSAAPPPPPTPVARPIPIVVHEPAPPPPPGELSIAVAPVPARIEVDGRVITSGERTATVHFDQTGEHAVVITAPGRRAWRKTVQVERGMKVELPVTLERLPPAPHDRNYVVDPFSGNQKR